MNSIYIRLVTLNRVKLGRVVTVTINVASLIFLPKTLIWNKITFPASNSFSQLSVWIVRDCTFQIREYSSTDWTKIQTATL